MVRFVFSLLLLIVSFVAVAQAKLYLIPTLHGVHKTNAMYTYDSLQTIIGRINPDVIAVEMRSEDIGTDSNYLKANYPYEMWMMPYWFPSPTIVGFDWLGKELEGKQIPVNYWTDQSVVKRLEKQLTLDTAMAKKEEACELYARERTKIVMSASLKMIINSSYAILTRSYYDCIGMQLQGTEYALLPDFFKQRNMVMQQNILRIIADNQNKVVVIVTGDDRYPYLLEHLHKAKIRVQPL